MVLALTMFMLLILVLLLQRMVRLKVQVVILNKLMTNQKGIVYRGQLRETINL